MSKSLYESALDPCAEVSNDGDDRLTGSGFCDEESSSCVGVLISAHVCVHTSLF